MDSQVLFAFGLTLFAGLSTGIGSAIAFVAKRTNSKLLAVSLGLSAGVMLYISFVELLNNSITSLADKYGDHIGNLYAVLAFFGGILLIMVIDLLVPSPDNPHEVYSIEDITIGEKMGIEERKKKHKPLLRTGLMTALVLAIHNFPEGMVTFLTALHDTDLAIPIAVAIAIHNIPEGISVSVPIFYATGSKKRAFWISFASGLAEPLGALVGYLLIAPFLTITLMSLLNAAIAGIMVYISLDELLPTAEKYGKHHHAILGVILGMAVMALTLVLL